MSDGHAETGGGQVQWVRPAVALSVGVHLFAVAVLFGVAAFSRPISRIVFVDLVAPASAAAPALPGAPAGGSRRPASPHRQSVPKAAAARTDSPQPPPMRAVGSPLVASTPVSPAGLVSPTNVAGDGPSAAHPPSPMVVPSAFGPSLPRETGSGGVGAGSPSVAGNGTTGVDSGRGALGSPIPGDGSGVIPRAPRALRDRIQSRVAYPAESIRQDEEGEVLLRVLVGADGVPREIRLHRSSGIRRLDEAARRGVIGATPLPSSPGWYEVPVRFNLR